MVDAPSIERGRTPTKSVNFVAFVEQKLGQVGAGLAGHASNESDFSHGGRLQDAGGFVHGRVVARGG